MYILQFMLLQVDPSYELADVSDRGINVIRLGRHFQALLNFFWKRFTKEYIRVLVDRREGTWRTETLRIIHD